MHVWPPRLGTVAATIRPELLERTGTTLATTSAPRLGERFTEALGYAAELHHDQVRKGSGTPYVSHLLAAASLVLEHGGSEDQAIAALLHDALEDQSDRTSAEELAKRYGPEVTRIVVACSDATSGDKPPWQERKERYLAHLEATDEAVLLVSCADKLHNARSILRDLRQDGPALWDRFTADVAGQRWYYGSLADVFARRLPGPLSDELRRTVNAILDEAVAT